MTKCIDCNKKLLDYRSKRCKSCEMEQRKKNAYTLKTYICKDCGKEISCFSGYLGQGRCGSCASKIRSRGKNNPNYKDGRRNEIYYCIEPNCSNKICYNNWYYGNKRCEKCNKKHLIGKKHPRYIHGKGNEPYPLEFNDKLKETIRQRDDYTCQKCNITEEEHLIVYGIKLPIHHIDYNKFNCEEDNLITLCKECNTKVNSNRNYWYAYFIYIMEKKYAKIL